MVHSLAHSKEHAPGALARSAIPLMMVFLVAGACLFASGLNSAVHARVSWLGLLPLLILVRCAPPLWAAVGGGLWGLCVWFFAARGWSTGIPSTAYLGFAAIGCGFGLVGAVATRRFGFHPFLLSAAWLLLEFAIRPPPGDVENGGLSSLVVRALGATCLGSILVFCNGVLVWVLCALLRRLHAARWARTPAVYSTIGTNTVHIPDLLVAFRGYPRGPPIRQMALIHN